MLHRLQWADVDTRLHLATILRTKNGEVKHMPLNAVAEALPRYGAPVLAWPWGEPLSDTTLYAAFQRTCDAAGIADCTWHTLRHTFASHLIMAGVASGRRRSCSGTRT